MEIQDYKAKFLKSLWPSFFTIVLLLFGFFGGTWFATSRQNNITLSPQIREGGYQFISPLLIGPTINSDNDKLSVSLKKEINNEIFDLVDNPNISLVSVYFRDLTNANAVGIKQDQLFDSGSLIKVSLLIAALKENEGNPGFLSKEVTYSGRVQPAQNSQFEGLTKGETYTISNLLNYMIIKSDNDAKDLLLANIDWKIIQDLFQTLQLPIPDRKKPYYISPTTASYFFRILYNANYLTKQDSEYALQLLSKAEYKDGLVAGVPTDTVVAHKYGEAVAKDSLGNNLVELHDCGIVYYSNHPYFLCIMTRGDNIQGLTEIIRRISQVVYQNISGK